MSYSETLFNRYLNVLDIGPEEPSVSALFEVVRAHLTKVPFENISKLIYKKQGLKNIPELSVYLNGIEKFNFGGTCYSNNYYLYLLLRYLGYDIKLCGADMDNPDVHIVSMVRIEGREFIIDVGYAAPFIEPMPRDLKENYNVVLGDEKYILYPLDESGRTKVEHYQNGKLKHGYTAKPEPCEFNKFCTVIEDSYSNDAEFMNRVMIAKFYDNSAIVLRNLTLLRSAKNSVTKQSIMRNEITDVVESSFGIPKQIVYEAINDIII